MTTQDQTQLYNTLWKVTKKNILEHLGISEKINNFNFNYPEFGVIEKEAGGK